MIVVTVARKPLASSNVASNVISHGAGAMNIDACRIAAEERMLCSNTSGREGLFRAGLKGGRGHDDAREVAGEPAPL